MKSANDRVPRLHPTVWCLPCALHTHTSAVGSENELFYMFYGGISMTSES
jgi:hypothetical protein